MTTELEVGLYILILAGFLGYHLITRVPPLLHTPLMSATNAIAGISLVGSLVIAGQAETTAATVLGTIAVACSATNVVGGFLITDRMLRMFKKDAGKTTGRRIEPGLAVLLTTVVSIVGVLALLSWASTRAEGIESIVPRDTAAHALRYSYILSAALFILGLKGLSSPKSARSGMFLAEIGMLLAIIGTLFHPEIVTFKWIILGLVVGVG